MHATAWIDLENIMLSARRQTQKTTYFCSYGSPEKGYL